MTGTTKMMSDRSMTTEDWSKLLASIDRGHVLKIVDGGAFSWTYALIAPSAWISVRDSYVGAIICLDSAQSVRRDEVPYYKGRRSDRRKTDTRIQDRRAQVAEFWQMIRADKDLTFHSKDGYEADDLVVLNYLQAVDEDKQPRVFGVDKDLLQVPGLYSSMRMWDGSSRVIDLSSCPSRTPGYWPGTRDERDVLLAQLLFGDRSDSIPRVLGRGDKYGARRLHRELEHPFSRAYELYGKQVVDNLWQLLMPHPSLSVLSDVYRLNPEKLLLDIDDRSYWQVVNFRHHWHRVAGK
jgi:5'-3' exonuclease